MSQKVERYVKKQQQFFSVRSFITPKFFSKSTLSFTVTN